MFRSLLMAVALFVAAPVSASFVSTVTGTFSLNAVGDTAHIYRDFVGENTPTSFLDIYTLNIGAPGFPVSIAGEHDGLLFHRLLLTDTNDLVGDGKWRRTYLLGEDFSAEIEMVDPGAYTLKLWGGALSQSSYYDISLTAVPLPAAAWLFGSAILGVAGYRRYLRGRAEVG